MASSTSECTTVPRAGSRRSGPGVRETTMTGRGFGTWQRGSALARWTYRIPLAAGEPTAGGFVRSIDALERSAGGFGTVTEIELSTAERGDEAYVFRNGESLDAVARAVTGPERVVQAAVTLDLAMRPAEGEPDVAIFGGMTIWLVTFEDLVAVHELEMWVSLDVDFYARQSSALDSSNERLAALNAPRLAGFLRAVRDNLAARLIEIEGDVELAEAAGATVE